MIEFLICEANLGHGFKLLKLNINDRAIIDFFLHYLLSKGFMTGFFLWRGTVNPSTNPHAGGNPVFRFLRLLIQYIRSYTPYLVALSTNPEMPWAARQFT